MVERVRRAASAARRVERIGDATLYLGDCREIVPEVKPSLTVTSPPYNQQRMYEGNMGEWDDVVPPALCIIRSGQVLVNLGLVHRDGEVVEYWKPLLEQMREHRWRFFGWYVWDQGPGMMGDWQGRLAPAHEWVFHFNKESRKPNKSVEAKYDGYTRRTPQTGMRKADGSMSGWSHGTAPTQGMKIADSVIRVTRHKHQKGMLEAEHPAVFPVGLPSALIEAYSSYDEIVLDPFMGSGTTGVACARLGRKFVGIEIEPKYFDIACRRIEDEYRRGDFLSKPNKPKSKQSGFGE